MDRKINFRRWSDVILLGLVSYALVYLIASVSAVQVAFGKWVSLFSSLHMAGQILLALTGFYCACHLLLFFNVIHKRQLKNIQLCLAYPPITFSIVLCLLLFLSQFDVINFFRVSLFASYFLAAALLLIIFLSLLCAYDSLYSEKRKDKQEHFLVPGWITNEEQKNHYRWLMSECPLDEDEKDMLGREMYCERIARLFEPIDGDIKRKANHIAIVGPFGIGKTSLWRSVENKLGEEFVFVPVDGWGRSNNTAAAQIIDEMVAALSTYVDCAGIRSVPMDYSEVLAGADFQGASFLGKMLTLHNHQSPDKLMLKIDAILQAIGKTMVVVLEDFDRNPNAENGINEIAGLLDRLRNFKTINFIVCLAPGVKSHVLSRISTYREDLLSCDALELVKTTIELMFDYASTRADPILLDTKDIDVESFSATMNSLIKTPRDAKYALRRSYTAWKSLAGEVNIYDLLAINVLRYSAPEAFDFVVRNFDSLRKGVVDIEKHVQDFKRDADMSSMTTILEGEDSSKVLHKINGYDETVFNVVDLFSSAGIKEKSARNFIKMLFPYWNSIDGVGRGDDALRVSGRQGNFYLERIIKEVISAEHVAYSDVEFLKGFDSARDDEDSFIEKLSSSKYWTEKYIEKISSWVPIYDNDYVPADIVRKFIKFLVARFRLGKDVFCNEIYGIESRLPLLIEKIDIAAENETVFSRFLGEIQDEPEMLFSAIQKSEKYANGLHSYKEQYMFWIDQKSKLIEYFKSSCLLSEERKVEVVQFLNGLKKN